MELTINELDDYHNKNVSWLEPEIEGTNDRTFSAQQYNPAVLQPPSNRGSLNRRQVSQPQLKLPLQQPDKRDPLNYDDILLKLNVQIVNGVMRYIDPRKGFTFENAAKTNAQPNSQVKPQVKSQVNAKPLTEEEHKECRIKQEMDRRRLNQVKTTKMFIPNNNATTFRQSATAAPSVKAPVTNNSGLFKMKMGR